MRRHNQVVGFSRQSNLPGSFIYAGDLQDATGRVCGVQSGERAALAKAKAVQTLTARGVCELERQERWQL